MLKENKVKELEAKIQVLEEENFLLSEHKEELLLLGLIAEAMETEEDTRSLLDTVLERISILKDVPFCAFFSIKNIAPCLISSYSSFQKSEIMNSQVILSKDIISNIRQRTLIVDKCDDEKFCILKKTETAFMPIAAIFIHFSCPYLPNGLFVFADDKRDKNELTRLAILLQRVVDMTAAKIENISLVNDLTRINKKLDAKILERTKELQKSNKNLERQMEEQKKLKEQFYQAQKMEAIGKLAGGVAHDFNNLLTVINGYSDILLLKLEKNNPLYHYVEQIGGAGKRAASLTDQLLAFSRKQVIKPQIISMNTVVYDSEKMLQRLIGENIHFQTILDPNLYPVKADPGQIEQVVMNLAVNARDAMSHGGTLTIQTANAVITEDDIRTHPELELGHYAHLSVRDNGIGIDRETQTQIFDPFFTTKAKGEGTGLGLSTVFGIVKQNNGFITVRSSPGKGSVFNIYFPRSREKEAPVSEPRKETGKVKGSETILLVEDDESVRELVADVLQETGFSVLSATSAEEAFHLAEQFGDKIHLMLTDVVMPGISGKELADKLNQQIPGLKVVFMSGYTDDIITKQGVLIEKFEYVQKPFSPHYLVHKIREVLDKD